jgi:hypothetical protein
MKDLFKLLKNFFGILYVLGILGLAGILIYIGFLYLVGDLEVEKSPEVIPNKSQYECSYSERLGEYYCPDPPEQWQDEFPARP